MLDLAAILGHCASYIGLTDLKNMADYHEEPKLFKAFKKLLEALEREKQRQDENCFMSDWLEYLITTLYANKCSISHLIQVYISRNHVRITNGSIKADILTVFKKKTEI